MKDLGEASYIFGIKIYRDRSRKLLGLFQSIYIDTLLKQFNIDNSQKGYLLIGHGITLSKKDCSITPKKRECMNTICFDSGIYHVCYDMYEARCGLFTRVSE